MSARDEILKLVAANKPDLIPLSLPSFPIESNTEFIVEKFIDVLESIGGKAQVVNDFNEINTHLLQIAADGKRVVNKVKGLGFPVATTTGMEEAAFYEDVFVACIRGLVAVAENGSVWVVEEDMGNRQIPFICQHLVLVINRSNLVANMHEAYRVIDAATTKYGLFIAGPSKTADIEQSLVIGAHGARSLKVFIVEG